MNPSHSAPVKAPLVSVVIPSYNRADVVGRAVRSVLDQTYNILEAIVVDDASADSTESIVNAFADPRVRFIRHEVNRGVSAARNSGIRAAKGDLIGFLDSDDEWLPAKLERQVARFSGAPEGTGLVYGSCLMVDEETQAPVRVVTARHGGRVLPQMLLRDFIMSPTPLVRSQCFERVGLFDEGFKTSEDWDMWLRIAGEYDFDFVDEIVARHYLSPSQTTSRVEHVVEGYLEFLEKHRAEMSPALLAHHYKTMGQMYTIHGQYGAARARFVQAIRMAPCNPTLYAHLFVASVLPRVYVAMGKRINRHAEGIRYAWRT